MVQHPGQNHRQDPHLLTVIYDTSLKGNKVLHTMLSADHCVAAYLCLVRHGCKPSFYSDAGAAHGGAAVAAVRGGGGRGGRARPDPRRVCRAAVAGSCKARRRPEGGIGLMSLVCDTRITHGTIPQSSLSCHRHVSHPNHRLSHFLPPQQLLIMKQSASSLLIVSCTCDDSSNMAESACWSSAMSLPLLPIGDRSTCLEIAQIPRVPDHGYRCLSGPGPGAGSF